LDTSPNRERADDSPKIDAIAHANRRVGGRGRVAGAASTLRGGAIESARARSNS